MAPLSTVCHGLGLDWTRMGDLPLQANLAHFDTDPHAFAERVRTVVPLNDFSCGQTHEGFRHAGAALVCGELTLTSTIHTALEIELGEHPFATLAIPYAGLTGIRIDRREMTLRAGATAVYMPGEAYAGRTEAYAGVMLNLPHHSLTRTAQAIAGGEASTSHCRQTLQRPVVLGDDGPVRSELLLSLRRVLSAYNGSALLTASAIRSLALEDAIQRLVILLLCPELLAESGADRMVARQGANGRDRIFDELIEWILADLTRPLTLSELERHSGYSRRSLQYMFRSRFGLGPMQWLRQQRLQAVRTGLMQGTAGETVAGIATRFGFISTSSFARLFQTTFGQPPSELLRDAQRRRF